MLETISSRIGAGWTPLQPFEFVERHRFKQGIRLSHEEDDRVVSLLSNWGEIDPSAARNWLEADASRQTKDTFRAFVTSWGRVDRAGAIDYAVANARQPDFEGAVNELVYQFVRSAKEDATRLIMLLPPERAKAALKNVADIINPEVINPNLDRPPPEEVLNLSSRIRDRRMRDVVVGEYARRLGNEWRNSDEAISELPISDQAKAYLRRVMREGE